MDMRANEIRKKASDSVLNTRNVVGSVQFLDVRLSRKANS
jgi:hypothetical protein